MSAAETVALLTEEDARPFYGQRVWVHYCGERLRRTIEPDNQPAGDGRTLGEFYDRVILRARSHLSLVGLRSGNLLVEVGQ
jgi:hypothetical protein